MTSQEQANIITLIGLPATRRGYELFNENGDNLGVTLSERDVDFILSHQCVSDCRREGCEKVGANV